MADMVLSAVTQKLADIAGDMIVRVGSRSFRLKDDIRWIESEMRFIRSYLEDVDRKQRGGRGVSELIRSIWDLAYDAEDIIHTYPRNVASQRRAGWLKKVKRILLSYKTARDFAVEIEGIKRRVEDINRIRKTYGIRESSGRDEGDTWDPRRSFPHIDDVNVVGFSNQIEELVAEVIDEDLRCGVVSIAGMAGLGKTTLAKKVYRSVQQKFERSAWIYVSQQPSINRLLQDIARQVGLERKEWEHNVEANLFNFLSQKRYVIVIDDLWRIEPWNALKIAIPSNSEKGSRIIITSRNRDVGVNIGRQVGGRSFLHDLRPLDLKNSRELFYKMIMAAPQEDNNGSNDLSQLEDIGEQILRRCGGVPLAIVATVGLLLSRVRTKHAWEWVLRMMGKNEDQYSEIFALSYKDLPIRLKPCFLYFGLFPEDYEVFAFDLINLWIAEGFIESDGVREVEDVGNDYLNHLIGRNLIQVARRRFNGRVRSCRIHDIFHALCIHEANEINFFSTLDDVTNSNRASALRARRVIAHRSRFDDYISLNRRTPKLRAMMSFHGSLPRNLVGGSKFLRVLSIHGSNSFPKDIGKLKHLSYLKLELLCIELPYTIRNLNSLLTLDIARCRGVVLPNVVWEMKQLRNILLPFYCWAPTFRKINLDRCRPIEISLPNLQTLIGVKSEIFEANWLHKLTNLRKLTVNSPTKRFVEALSDGPPFAATLETLELFSREECMTTLNLSRFENLDNLKLRVQIVKFLEPNNLPPNLTKLTLEDTKLQTNPMENLKKLPKLKVLKFGRWSFAGGAMVCSGQPGNFPQLQVLKIELLVNLKMVVVEEGGMPNLKQFSICHCNPITWVPDRIRDIMTIENQVFEFRDAEIARRLYQYGIL